MCIVFPCQGWNSLSYSLGLFFLGLDCQFLKYPLGVENLYEQILVSFLVHAEYLPCIALRPLDSITKARFPIGPEHGEEKGNIIALFFPLCAPFRCSFTFDIGENNKKATRRCNCLRHNSSGIEKFRADVDVCRRPAPARPRLSSPARHLDNTQG